MDKFLFLKKMPAVLTELVEFFGKRDLELCVVGGIPRDFLLTSELGIDWDIEVFSSRAVFSHSFWKDLGRDLKSRGEVSFLPYEVIRLRVDGIEFEFSPPRKEIYNDALDHKNFEAEFDFRFLQSESWKRRDFTINAIGVHLKKNDLEIIDPFEGVRMLREKRLHPCSQDFVRDPVRYLRAYRFKEKLGFDFSQVLALELKKMSHTFSPHYLYSEMKKSKNALGFYRSLLKDGCETLPSRDAFIKGPEFESLLVESANLYSWIMALEFGGISSLEFAKYFGLSLPLQKKLNAFAAVSGKLKSIDLEIVQKDFEAVANSSELEIIYSWYYSALQLRMKSEISFIEKFIRTHLAEWALLLDLEALKDVRHIEPALRAKYIVWNLCQRL